MAEWTMDVSEFRVAAERYGGRQRVMIEVESESLDFDVEAGSGHMREHQTFRVPVLVIVKLLEAKGFTVSLPSTECMSEAVATNEKGKDR
jgi:hypothetical protein